MKPKNPYRRSSLFCTLSVAIFLSPAAAHADAITWEGDVDSAYTNGLNWAGDNVPANDLTTDIATFPVTITGSQPALSAGPRSVAGLDFLAGGWTLSGTETLSLGSGGINSLGNNVVSAPLDIGTAGTTFTTNSGYVSLSNTASDAVIGTGQLTIAGNGTVYMDGTSNSYSGGTYITGKVQIKGNNSLGSGNVTLAGGALGSNGANVDMGVTRTVSLIGGGTLFASGGRIGTSNDVSGTGPLTIGAGNSVVYLDVVNTFTGGMILKGALGAKSTGSMGEATGPIVFDGGTLQTNGNNLVLANTRTVTLNAGGGTLKAAGGKYISVATAIDGIGQLTVAGELVFLDVNNSFSGGIVINNNGVLRAKTGGALGDAANAILIDGGTLGNNNSGTDTGSRVITLGAGGAIFDASGNTSKRLGVGSLITGSGQLTITGTGTVFLDNGSNNFTSGIIVKGLARPKGNGTLGDVNGAITMDGGIFHPNQGGVTYPATRAFILGAGGGTFTPNGTTTIDDAIEGVGSLTVTGASGTLVLAGTNTYTGDTIVNGELNAAPPVSPGAILVVDGDTLPDGGALRINNDLGVTTNGQVQAVGVEQVGALYLNGVLQSAGRTYGSTSSGADVQDDNFFSGNGYINVVTPASDYNTWAALYSPADLSDMEGDNDNDGLTNQQEYAFGLNPVSGASVNPYLASDLAGGTFSYQRRATTDLDYTIETSPDLSVWTPDTGAIQDATAAGDNENVLVTPSGPLPTTKFFFRVKAD